MLTEYQPPNSRQNQKCLKTFISAYFSLWETKVLGTSEAYIISILQRLLLYAEHIQTQGEGTFLL